MIGPTTLQNWQSLVMLNIHLPYDFTISLLGILFPKGNKCSVHKKDLYSNVSNSFVNFSNLETIEVFLTGLQGCNVLFYILSSLL